MLLAMRNEGNGAERGIKEFHSTGYVSVRKMWR
jgi:hypothetical protein